MIEDQLVAWLGEGLVAAAPGSAWTGDLPAPELLAPKQKDHGDFATNVALALAKRAGRPPREVAQAIVDALPPAPFVEKVEVAGPGFLNIFTTDDWLHDGAPRRGRRGRALRAGRAERPARAGGVREREPDRAAAHRARAQRRAGRRARAAARGRRLDRRARVLLQRRRPPDGPVRGVGGGALPAGARARGRDARGRLPRRVPGGDRRGHRGRARRRARRPPARGAPGAAARRGIRRVLAQIEATLERFGVRFDVYFCEAELARKGEIDGRDRAAARRRLRLRRRGRRVVPLDGVRRRQGPGRDPVQRRAHVLRGRLRVPDRQVLAGLRPRGLRLGRRPPRRRRAGEGRRRRRWASTRRRSRSCCTSSSRSCATARS